MLPVLFQLLLMGAWIAQLKTMKLYTSSPVKKEQQKLTLFDVVKFREGLQVEMCMQLNEQ